jgi:hypothetical protein
MRTDKSTLALQSTKNEFQAPQPRFSGSKRSHDQLQTEYGHVGLWHHWKPPPFHSDNTQKAITFVFTPSNTITNQKEPLSIEFSNHNEPKQNPEVREEGFDESRADRLFVPDE